jgi:hypothetical protein
MRRDSGCAALPRARCGRTMENELTAIVEALVTLTDTNCTRWSLGPNGCLPRSLTARHPRNLYYILSNRGSHSMKSAGVVATKVDIALIAQCGRTGIPSEYPKLAAIAGRHQSSGHTSGLLRSTWGPGRWPWIALGSILILVGASSPMALRQRTSIAWPAPGVGAVVPAAAHGFSEPSQTCGTAECVGSQHSLHARRVQAEAHPHNSPTHMCFGLQLSRPPLLGAHRAPYFNRGAPQVAHQPASRNSRHPTSV